MSALANACLAGAFLILAAAFVLPMFRKRTPAPRPALPAGWHADPENPARSIHEPRSGTGRSNITHYVGGSGAAAQILLGGGGGGSGGQARYEPLWMPDCPACGRPVPATGESCPCIGEG